ncbi:anti sigma factor C-terminal domain-containing protein [Clostridium paraputrificum]|uniref:anti-sigma factor n=1 Tax=Clostridium paraputrificum TaxID=29363 RepID=UPI003D332113
MGIKSDDERLEELFNMNEAPDFNRTIRKAKMFSIMRTIIVSFMIFIIISFGVLIFNTTTLNKMSIKEERRLNNSFRVSMPNAYLGGIQIDDRIMVGEINYVRYRFLGNKPVTDGSYKEEYTYMPLINGIYGDMGNYLYTGSYNQSEEVSDYNKAGKKVMKFYHPSVEYSNYINDLGNLSEIEDNKLMEVSLSFNKAYSIDEVKNMIPSDITLNWYWVDTFTTNAKELSEKTSFNEYDVYGIKALDNRGNPIDRPEDDFIGVIQQSKIDNGQYAEIFNTLCNGKEEINKDDLKIIGVVVSGDSKSLKNLKNNEYIKGATIGAIVDKY